MQRRRGLRRGGKPVPWSRRTEWDLTETAWAQALARLRAAKAPLYDLTASNPTRCGFHYPVEALLRPLAQTEALLYDPDPRGLLPAREAVRRYYRDHGAEVAPDHLLLTTSTSEGYSFLFRLLCDPGDEVLIAQPGYPLFDFLAQLDDVRLVPYELFYDHGWQLDLQALRGKVGPRTRAIVVVHPNNPTGHFTSAAERGALEQLCREHGLALIVDEVFLDYGRPGTAGASFARGPHPVPTFVLSGLSKVAALPQMKAAWIACFAATEALQRLEVISDTFLSLSAPIQWAMPHWLRERSHVQQQIRARVEANLATLDSALRQQTLLSRLHFEAGWYAVVRVPRLQPEEQMGLALLLERGVVVHTGGFFGFAGQGWLVVSLLGQEEEFAAGVQATVEHFRCLIAQEWIAD
jgi:alanine-synthesizing transaminase